MVELYVMLVQMSSKKTETMTLMTVRGFLTVGGWWLIATMVVKWALRKGLDLYKSERELKSS